MNELNRRDAEPQSSFSYEPDVRGSRSWFLGVSASLRLILFFAALTTACSIPNLEEPECDQARDVVREFYSLHFGNDMTFSPENLEIRRRYLTSRFYDELRATPLAVDPFTRTNDLPKAFRAGECKVTEAGRRARFDVLLFWKTDTRTEQRSITVEMENEGGNWLIDGVGS